jgi:hypothetical protein
MTITRFSERNLLGSLSIKRAGGGMAASPSAADANGESTEIRVLFLVTSRDACVSAAMVSAGSAVDWWTAFRVALKAALSAEGVVGSPPLSSILPRKRCASEEQISSRVEKRKLRA